MGNTCPRVARAYHNLSSCTFYVNGVVDESTERAAACETAYKTSLLEIKCQNLLLYRPTPIGRRQALTARS